MYQIPVLTESIKASEYESCVLDCNLENWYPLLKRVTFYTDFIQLTQEDANIIMETYRFKLLLLVIIIIITILIPINPYRRV